MMRCDSPLAASLPSFLRPCDFVIFFFLTILLLSNWAYASEALAPLCLTNRSSALLQFKRGIVLQPGKLSSWKKGSDCCHWEGVTCDSLTGFVTALQIPTVSEDGFVNSSRLDPSLFRLSHLQVLDLRNNGFNGMIPKRLVELTRLTHLDLSNCRFSGAVPTEISQLTRLVYLNLSASSGDLQLENSNFTNLVRGLRRLEHLALDQVAISMSGKSLSTITSSFLPSLQTLSLVNCGIFGTLDESILQLRSLSYIDMSNNQLSNIPEHFLNFTSLRVLKLAYCNLVTCPTGIFLLPKLETLDVSSNSDLVVSLPTEAIPRSSNIQYLDLSYIKEVHGDLVVLSNLTKLSHFNLRGCANNGTIPSSWASNRLVVVDLSFNNLKGSIPKGFCSSPNLTILYLSSNLLSGTIPPCLFNISYLEEIDLSQNLLSSGISLSFFNLPSIKTIDLSHNVLSGSIHSSIFHLPTLKKLTLFNNQLTGETPTVVDLPSLEELLLSNNMLSGSISPSLLNLPSLRMLDLENNRFNGLLPGFFNPHSVLTDLNLRKNCFVGVIPSSISTLSVLMKADLSSNCFNGTTNLFPFLSMHVLQLLDLSNNKGLTILDSPNSSYSYHGSTGLQMLETLNLSSCNIESFPSFLHKLENLHVLDLSNSGIRGKVPSWLWGIPGLEALVLDHNKIEGFENTVNNSQIEYLSAHDNEIVGAIPTFFCSFTRLTILDLSKNGLTGTTPNCLGSLYYLRVLNLAENQLRGQIPALTLVEFISFSGNLLSGKIDPEALRNCTYLQVLDLGYNHLNDTFPSWLSSYVDLKVLVLRSNHLFGPITLSGSGQAFFSTLHILDISNNHFLGPLPHKLFKSLKAMMGNESKSEFGFGSDTPFLDFPYAPSFVPHPSQNILRDYLVTLIQTIKRKNMSVPKIMKTLFIIDLSNNIFTDKIPEEIGMLKDLLILNISNNNLSGTIPKSLGNVQQMEALDLSCNHLSGVIPEELSALTFLAILNLSYNELRGHIPQGHQFNTFDESSFEGNPGLCGAQIPQRPCTHGRDDHGVHQQTSVDYKVGAKEEKHWKYGALGIGFAAGLLLITLPILLNETISNWYWNLIDRLEQFFMQVFFCKAFK